MRFKIDNRFRNEEESVADFVAALWNVAEHVNLMIIRDRIRDKKNTAKSPGGEKVSIYEGI